MSWWIFIKYVFHIIMAFTVALVAKAWVGNTPGFRGTPYPDIVGFIVGFSYLWICYMIMARDYHRHMRYIKTHVIPKNFNPSIEVYGNGGDCYFAYDKPRDELVIYDRKQKVKLVKPGSYLRGYETEVKRTRTGEFDFCWLKLQLNDPDFPFIRFYVNPPHIEKQLAKLDLVLNG